MYQSYISVYHTILSLSNLNSHHSHHFHSSCQLSTQTFNTLSQNSTSKQSLLPPQLMSFSLVIFVDMPQMTPFFTHTHNNTLHCTLLHYTYTTLVNDTLVPPQGYGPRRPTRALFISPVS